MFEYKMEFPVSAVHMMQVTGRDEFLLIVSVNLATALPAATWCAALSALWSGATRKLLSGREWPA